MERGHMEKIRLALFTAPMGHDVERVSDELCRWFAQDGRFAIARAGWYRGAPRTVDAFMADEEAARQTDIFLLNCPDDTFTTPEAKRALENAVAGGAGILNYHGVQVGCRDWSEMEKIVGLLWRETASHGDYDFFDVYPMPERAEHPIMRGIQPFRTKEELYCGLTNVQNVPLEILAAAHSPKERLSRHGHPGTGNEEPVLTLGRYGEGVTVNFLLGHVWPFYTGHGLLENTLRSLRPPEVRELLVRSCVWAARGHTLL